MIIVVFVVPCLVSLVVIAAPTASSTIVGRMSSSPPLGRSPSAHCCFTVSQSPGSPGRPIRQCEESWSSSAHFVCPPPPLARIARGLPTSGGRTATLFLAMHPGGTGRRRSFRLRFRSRGLVRVRSSPCEDGDEGESRRAGGGDWIGSTSSHAGRGRGGTNGQRFSSSGNVVNRRSVLGRTVAAMAAIAMPMGQYRPRGAAAVAAAKAGEPFARRGKGYGYSFVPPAGFVVTGKPLKTHLDEVNFERRGDDGGGGEVKGYQFGITVDPVRIDSLRQFGTPGEVAARVVMAELNRDGVMDVTLDSTREVATSVVEDRGSGDHSPSYYAIDYVSSGKRGIKKYLTKICIMDQRLYVLTAQIKESDYATYRKEISDAVNSFEVAHGD